MKLKIALAITLAISVLNAHLSAEQKQGETIYFEQVEMVPLSTLQLGDAAFIAPEWFENLEMMQGQAARVESETGSAIDVFLYPLDRSEKSISLKRSLRDALNVEPGPASIELTLLNSDETEKEPVDLTIRISANHGDRGKWPGIIVGAPHGDCDLHTGDIVERMTENSGIPSVSAYKIRMSYLGRWIDTNRPLERKPAELFGIEPSRSWTPEAEAVYHEFRDKALSLNKKKAVQDGEAPLNLYVDFHGHDLTYTAPDGSRKGRDVLECMARGFSLDEVRWLKENLNETLKEYFGDDAPTSYWGNLPEDRTYTCETDEVEFFYSGLGGRVYGTLSSEFSDRAIHIESPNSIRLDSDIRPVTSKMLEQFISDVSIKFFHDTENRTEWVSTDGGDFIRGGDEGEGWSSIRPSHPVRLSPFSISKYEVTNQQYCDYLNQQNGFGKIEIEEGLVINSEGELLLRIGPKAAHSRIDYSKKTFTPKSGFEDHPVVHVTWNGAKNYASNYGARLPTEAEWEFAAGWSPQKGEAVRWKEKEDPEYDDMIQGNYMHSDFQEENLSHQGTTPAGFFEYESPIGCKDMIGNVWEWTEDWYGNYTRTEEPLENPSGPEEGTMKVVRGGAWDTEPSTATSVFRLGVAPHQPLPTLGFRIVKDGDPPP